jgi:hypothetical protein
MSDRAVLEELRYSTLIKDMKSFGAPIPEGFRDWKIEEREEYFYEYLGNKDE